jgi:hypothetical protein
MVVSMNSGALVAAHVGLLSNIASAPTYSVRYSTGKGGYHER